MASRLRTIYVDSVNRKAYSSLTSKITLAIADFFVADEEILQIINCAPNPDQTSSLLFLNQPITGLLYAALGVAGQVATNGAFLLEDPVATQACSGIPFNVTASAFQASLRAALTSNYANCVVTQNGPGDYYVDRVTIGPIATSLTGDGTDLFPACFVNIIPVRVGVAAAGVNPGTSDVFRIILNQQPAAYTSSGWVSLPSAAVTVSQIVTGSSSPVQNAVFRVSINPDAYQGSFYLTANNLGSGNATTATSAAIDFDTTDVNMQAQIIAGWGTGNEVTVTEVNGYTWDVAFTGTYLAGKNLSAFTGNAAGLSVPVGLQGTLDLRTEAASAMVAGVPNSSVYFQIKNTDSNGVPQTWLYVNCTLNPTLISPSVLGSSNIPYPLTQQEGDMLYVHNAGAFTGFTGGGSTNFDSVVTLGQTVKTKAIAFISGLGYIYGLVSGTATLAAPYQVTPQDAGSSGFYWNLIRLFDTVSEPWNVQTANYTAVTGDRIQANTAAGAFTITLPATATVGEDIPIEDAALTWDVHNLTIAPNGLKINGGTSNYTGNIVGTRLSCVYISTAYGWSIK